MAYRRAHGTGRAALARVETAPSDELPEGVPGDPARERDPMTGRFRPGNRTSRAGGRAKSESRQLAALLGFARLPDDHALRPYQRLATQWRDDHAASVAMTVGGGQLSPGVSSIIASAALTLAASRALFDGAMRTGNTKLFARAARLADQSRQALLTAHELAAREAKAREQSRSTDVHAAVFEAFGEGNSR